MPIAETQIGATFERILLATDFSPAATVALRYAAGLSRRFSSTLELATVIDLSATTMSFDVVLRSTLQSMRHSDEEALGKLARTIQGIDVQTKVIEGFQPAALLLDEAAILHSDLIVVGTSSKHGLDRITLGSTAEEIIRKATCPVLTIGAHVGKPADNTISFRRIVYATDFSAEAARARDLAFSLAEVNGAEIFLCHVISDKEDSKEDGLGVESLNALKALIPGNVELCHPKCVIEHGKAAEAILGLAAEVRADLIVLGARKSSFWLTFIEQGLTPSLLVEARCPVLTVCSTNKQ
jgi:nucleotide-binding universal stress UspA family protein